MTDQPTAAGLIIGNEILSGRTQDVNLAHIARELGEIGVRLAKARVVPDIEAEIIDAPRGRGPYGITVTPEASTTRP